MMHDTETKMMIRRKMIRGLVVTILAAVSFTPLMSVSDELEVDSLMQELENQLQFSQERLDKLKPELKSMLEAKSSELSASVDTALDQGLEELEKLGKQYEAASRASSEKLQAFLDSKEVAELKSFLSGLDQQALSKARDELVTDFIEALELSADQIEKMKPLLREKLEKLGLILKRYMDQGKQDFEQFRVEFEAEVEKNMDKFKSILKPDQEKKLQDQMDSIENSIRTQVFKV